MSRRWTDEDLAMLREHYGRMPMAELAALLDRTVGTLYVVAGYHGLTKGRAGAARKAKPPQPAVEDEPDPLPEEPPAQPLAAPVRPPQHIVRAAADALIRHGVDEASAHIAAGVIARGQVPTLRFVQCENVT